jgi:hypothetical protein
MLAANDNWNFYASQCRIRIEMAFGLMKQKWGILQSPLRVQLKNVQRIVIAVAHLHNYCINERIGDLSVVLPSSQLQTVTEQLTMGMNGFSVCKEGQRICHATVEGVDIANDEYRSFSSNRLRMVERVQVRHLERPERYVRIQKRNTS